MHITPFGEKNFHLNTLLAISMAECLVANKILYYCYYYYLKKVLILKLRPYGGVSLKPILGNPGVTHPVPTL